MAKDKVLKEGREDPFGAIIFECIRISRYFLLFSCSFIKRFGDCLAHAIAYLSFFDLDFVEGNVLLATSASA